VARAASDESQLKLSFCSELDNCAGLLDIAEKLQEEVSSLNRLQWKLKVHDMVVQPELEWIHPRRPAKEDFRFEKQLDCPADDVVS
jgi:hypothetical protein